MTKRKFNEDRTKHKIKCIREQKKLQLTFQ